MANLKELSKKEPLFTCGHRSCAGCGAAIVARQVLMAAPKDVVCAIATGCLEVTSTVYPFSSWNCPVIHNAFANAAATISGVESAYKALKRKGKIKKDIKFIAFGGDGGTYDIGLQSLSGAIERGHDFLYICYDNEAYSNTGFQRSSATPFLAESSTSPYGKKITGKIQRRKNLTEIIAAHKIPYVAQTAAGFYNDIISKVEKALSIPGPKFINILSPCVLGWGINPKDTIKTAKLAVDSCFWPLYEVENGEYKLNYKPSVKKPVKEWLEKQSRFSHLLSNENKKLLSEFQKDVDSSWQELLQKSE